MSADLPKMPPIDQSRMLPYSAIRYVPGYPEQYVQEYAKAYAQEAARQAMEQRWISVDESLPEERARPYQVVAINRKKYGPMSVYAGEGIRSVLQDWVVRRWPHNLTHWMHMPPPPAEIARAAEAGGKENHG